MATHSSILAWRIPGTEEPGGLQSTGSHIGHDSSDLAAAERRFLNSNISFTLVIVPSIHVSNKAIAKIRGLPVHLKEFNVFIISIVMSISICHLTKLILQNVVQQNSGHYILLHFLIHKLVSSFLLRQTCRCQHTALQRVLLTLQPRIMVTQEGHRAQPCTVALAKKKKKKKIRKT